MIGIEDLRRKGLLGARMAGELLAKGFVSVMDLRGHSIKELYGERQTFDRESRRLRQTLKDMGMVWTRYIDFDKGVETFAMDAFDQMCTDFTQVEPWLREGLVHAQLADFYVRHFPEELFKLFNHLSEQDQIQCRSALLLFANRIYRHARQRGRDNEYEQGMLYLQSQVMYFSRTERYRNGSDLWRSFIQATYDWLAFFYFTLRERELIRQLGLCLPELLDMESIQIAQGVTVPLNLQHRIVSFVYKLRRLNDLYYSGSEEQVRQALANMPVVCLSEERQAEVTQLTHKLGYCPALSVIRLFFSQSPSPACRYWHYRLCVQQGNQRVFRPAMAQEDWLRILEDREEGRRRWQSWLPDRYRELCGDKGVKYALSPSDVRLLQNERMPVTLKGWFTLLGLIYRVDYISVDHCEAIIRRDKLPRFRARRVIEWAAQTRERMAEGVSTSVDEALQGAARVYHRSLLPLVEAACRKFRLPLPDRQGLIVAMTSRRVTRDRVFSILRERKVPMTLGEIRQALGERFPTLLIETDERLLRDMLQQDERFLSLKRTGYYGLMEWQSEGRLSIGQRVRILLGGKERPVSVEELLGPLQATHPALTLKNLRSTLRGLEGKGVRDYGLGFFGLQEVTYEGYTPLSVPLRQDPAFDSRLEEMRAYIADHQELPLATDEEGIRLALWWNRVETGMTRLTLAQKKRVRELVGWVSREGFPRDREEKAFWERCRQLMALAEAGRTPDGELLQWLRTQVARQRGLVGVRKRYLKELLRELQALGREWVTD